MIKKLTELLPLLIIGLAFFVFRGPKKPDFKEMPDPDSVPLALVGQPEAEPETGKELLLAEGPGFVAPEISSETTPSTLPLGGKFSVVLNKTSWDGLMKQTFADSEADALIDIHFNRYKGKNSGPLMIYSNEGKELAHALQREFIEIYEENGWDYDKEFDLRRMNLALTKRGDKAKKPVVVSEFGYVDDPRNPIAEYIQSLEGQIRIARAYRNAVRDLDIDSVMLSIGHHGNRGDEGAKTGSYAEQNFAIDIVTAIYNIGTPTERGTEADGYHHLADVEAEYSPEQIVFGARGQDLRKPAATEDKPDSGGKWVEVKTRTPNTSVSVSAQKPKRVFFPKFQAWRKSRQQPQNCPDGK